jgi:hypothetical protein
VQSTVDICSIHDAILARGAAHRDIRRIYFNIPVRCTLPASINIFTTNILRLCRFLIAKHPTTNGFYRREKLGISSL